MIVIVRCRQHAALVGAGGVRAVRLRLHAGVALGARAGAPPRRHLHGAARAARRAPPVRALRQRERQARAQGMTTTTELSRRLNTSTVLVAVPTIPYFRKSCNMIN